MINKELRYKRQTVFDLPDSRFKRIKFQNGDYMVYDNANLSLMLTDKCNADCDFCIAHLRYLVDGHTYIKPLLKNNDAYLNTFKHYWHKVLSQINPSISITGGEPTLYKNISSVVEMLNNISPRKKTITTNGTGLINDDYALLDSLLENGLDYLNISHAHWDKSKNDSLMRMNSDYLSDTQIEDIIKRSKEKGTRVRLSCALLKSGVHTLDHMKEYLDWAISIGCDNVIFRQLMQFDEQRVTPGRIPIFCKNEEIDLVPLWEQMDKDPNFEIYHQVLGYYYYVEVYKYKGIDLVTESADLRLIDQQISKYSEKFGIPTIFELVYHPNGTLGGSWREFERILMDSIQYE